MIGTSDDVVGGGDRGSGFIGRHVVEELARSGFEPLVRGRRRIGGRHSDRTRRIVDVTAGVRPLRAAHSGSAAVISAASHVGDDEQAQARVNVDGVAYAVDAATSLGNPLVHISTAGIYRALALRVAPKGGIRSVPSRRSAGRRAGGDAIAAAGGATVLRPLFITGVGDPHFFLRLLVAHVLLSAWIDDGTARLSVAPSNWLPARRSARRGGASPAKSARSSTSCPIGRLRRGISWWRR